MFYDLKTTKSKKVGEAEMNEETIGKLKECLRLLDCVGTREKCKEYIADAIVLLKEPVKPKKIKGFHPPMYTLYQYKCENCESLMLTGQPFCCGCGRSVKFE